MSRIIRRALVLVVLALVVLLVVADRLTEQATARALSVEARQSGLLASDPTVSIHGFPFLTQAARSRFTEIDVTTHGIHRGGLRVDTVIGRFRGLHVGLVAALDGRLSAVPIDSASGEVEITYADLDAFLAKRHITVTADGPTLSVRGLATVAGKTTTVSGPVVVDVSSAGTLTLVPIVATLRGPAGVLAGAAARSSATTLSVQVALAELPFGLTLRSATVGVGFLTITGAARGPAVAVPADASQS